MVQLNDLEMALDFSTGGEEFDSYAYVDSKTGKIYYVADDDEEDCPEDIASNARYIQVPHKREFDLGKSLAISFAEQQLPNQLEDVYQLFRSRGAYARFKALLDRQNLLDDWYQFEQQATQAALLEWCEEVGIEVSR